MLIAVGAAWLGCGRRTPLKSDGGADASRDLGATEHAVDATSDASDTVSAALDAWDTAGADVSDASPSEPVAQATDAAAADAADGGPETAGRRPYRAIAVAVGRYHSCALLDDHKVKCWGENGYGQLGLGDNKWRGHDPATMGDALPTIDLGTGRTAKTIAAGRYATCAILDTDQLKCWGLAQLTGLGEAGDRGTMPGQMGDALPAIDLGPGRIPTRIAVGHTTACVLRDNGTLRCWGTSDLPTEVPVNVTITDLAGAFSVLALLKDGDVAVVAPSAAMGIAPLPRARPARAVAGSAGGACVLLDGGAVDCGGGVGSPPAAAKLRAVALSERGFVAGALLDGSLRTWSAGAPSFPWTQVAADDPAGGFTLAVGGSVDALAGGGFDHSCALLAGGSVKCWSWSDPSNDDDELGGGHPDPTTSTWPAVDLGTRPR